MKPTNRSTGNPGATISSAVQVDTRYQVIPRATTRRVHRTIRRVEPWSVLKLSLVFYFSVMLIFLLGGGILYFVAAAAGIIEKMEKFIQGIGWPEFSIRPLQVFRLGLLLGLSQVVVWSTVNVFIAFLYNLVSDLVGGIEITMSEREF